MEAEAWAHQGRGGIWEARRVGVTRGGCVRGRADCVERWFDSEAAFSAAALGGGFFGGGESEGTGLRELELVDIVVLGGDFDGGDAAERTEEKAAERHGFVGEEEMGRGE